MSLLVIHIRMDLREMVLDFSNQIILLYCYFLSIMPDHGSNLSGSQILRTNFESNGDTFQFPMVEFPSRRVVISENRLINEIRSEKPKIGFGFDVSIN